MRYAGGVLARSLAVVTAPAINEPRWAPARTVASLADPASRTTRERPPLGLSLLWFVNRYDASTSPSATAWAVARLASPSTSASDVARVEHFAAARASAAAALRIAAGVRSLRAPTPIAITVAPEAVGMTRVWPGLPSNPSSARRARVSPSERETVPSDATGMPTASASRGAERATSIVRVMTTPW